MYSNNIQNFQESMTILNAYTKTVWKFIVCTSYLYGSKCSLGIHAFRLTWLCLIVKLLATWAKFLEPSGYCAVINCTPFAQQIFLVASVKLWPGLNSWSSSLIRLYYTFICAVFKSHMEWNNARCINAPTTVIQPSTEGTYHSLNCFSHVIYMTQSSICQKIAKPFPHPSISWFSLITFR